MIAPASLASPDGIVWHGYANCQMPWVDDHSFVVGFSRYGAPNGIMQGLFADLQLSGTLAHKFPNLRARRLPVWPWRRRRKVLRLLLVSIEVAEDPDHAVAHVRKEIWVCAYLVSNCFQASLTQAAACVSESGRLEPKVETVEKDTTCLPHNLPPQPLSCLSTFR
jgi:hypothetical protein